MDTNVVVRRRLRNLSSTKTSWPIIEYALTAPNGEKDMSDQLKMRLVSYKTLPTLSLPTGYQIRSYTTGDEAIWADIINRAGDLGEYTAQDVEQKLTGLSKFRTEGLLFITTDDGEAVATACAWLDNEGDWRSGQLHMVAVVPEHRGRKLSYFASAEVCRVFERWGVPEVHLTTDEFRKAAVKVYVDLAFSPVIRNIEHYDRWIAVYEEYGLPEQAKRITDHKLMALSA
jgi:mycothiol synthase